MEQDEDELIKLENSIRESLETPVPIIRVSTKRGKYKDEGKKLIEAYSYYVFWNSIKLRLPSRCKRVVQDDVAKWKEDKIASIKKELENKIKDKPFPFLAIPDIIGYLSDLDDLLEKDINDYSTELTISNGKGRKMIDNEIQQTLKIFGDFANELKYPPNNMDEILGRNISYEVVPINFKKDVERYFDQVNQKFNAQDFLGALGVIVQGAIDAAPFHNYDWLQQEIINNRIKPALSDTFNVYLNELENQVEKIIEDISPDNPFEN